METLGSILLAIAAAVLTYLYKNSETEQERNKRRDLELIVRRAQSKEKLKEHLIAQEGAKLGYEQAKKEFLNKYGSLINNSSNDGGEPQ